jgi:hypothetical protein
MPTLKLRLDDATMRRLRETASVLGYSGPEEMALHVIEKELDRLAPDAGETPEQLRRKLEGLGYMG